MLDKIRVLHELRKEKEWLDTELKQSKREWEEENEDLLLSRSDLVTDIEKMVAELKQWRVDEYDGEDKSKRFGLGIQERLQLEYDEEEALIWATEHKLALSLNKKKFETIAKGGDLGFVLLRHIATGTIAGDLSGYLEV